MWTKITHENFNENKSIVAQAINLGYSSQFAHIPVCYNLENSERGILQKREGAEIHYYNDETHEMVFILWHNVTFNKWFVKHIRVNRSSFEELGKIFLNRLDEVKLDKNTPSLLIIILEDHNSSFEDQLGYGVKSMIDGVKVIEY